MLSRFLVILLAVPLLIYILLVGDILFLLMCIVIIGISMYEYYSILIKKGIVVYKKIGLFLGISLPICLYYRNDIGKIFKYISVDKLEDISFEMGGFIVFATMLIAIKQITESRIKDSMSELTNTLFGVIYISFFLSYVIIIREGLKGGELIVLYTFFSIWACDTMAYIVGMLIGGKIFKRRLSEKISPKKSIEGFFGGILGVFFIGFYFDKIYLFIVIVMKNLGIINSSIEVSPLFLNENIIKLIVLSILIAVFSVLGDLFESKLKREYGVKDSGTILLGHGGFLDRFDSSLFVLPIVYYFIKYFL